MARFDIYPNPNENGYLLDVQTDLLSGLNTRLVVPLMPITNAPKPAKRLNPVMEINGSSHINGNADNITNALDMVFFGF